MDPKLQVLRRVPLFAGLGGREIQEVARLVDEVDLPAGAELTREGRSADQFFVILEGAVRIERGGIHVRTLGDGDFLGEIALVDGGPRTATATTDSPVRLLVIAHREFHSLLDRYPSIQMTVLKALAARVRRTDPSVID
jgi:CRP/FNR family transcriptional regulator, cyclic AMP receptor protein